MPGPLLPITAVGACPHGGQLKVVPTNARVLVGGQPVAVATDGFVVVGCTFAPVVPKPCVTARWLAPATRVLVGGRPPLLLTSGAVALSADQAPPWPMVVTSAQARVVGV